MSSRSASLITFIVAFVALFVVAMLLGCAARQPVTPSSGVVVHQQHLTVTIRAKDYPQLDFSRLVKIRVDNFTPDGFTISADVKTLTIETRLKGMEQEEGKAVISLVDSRGASASVTVEIPGGRKR